MAIYLPSQSIFFNRTATMIGHFSRITSVVEKCIEERSYYPFRSTLLNTAWPSFPLHPMSIGAIGPTDSSACLFRPISAADDVPGRKLRALGFIPTGEVLTRGEGVASESHCL